MGYCINMYISVHSSLFVVLMFPVESLNEKSLRSSQDLMLTYECEYGLWILWWCKYNG